MVKRKIVSESVIESDAFKDMPTSSKLLYYDLYMRSDDDGFVLAPGRIIDAIRSGLCDMQILVAKKFVTQLEGGAIIVHQTISREFEI